MGQSISKNKFLTSIRNTVINGFPIQNGSGRFGFQPKMGRISALQKTKSILKEECC
jgi:hypothetical protein